MRILAVLLFPLALAGCFTSDGPVFEEARGRCPFTTPTLFEEIADNEAEPIRMTFETDGAYCRFTRADKETERALFVPMGRNWWIVQGDEERPSYMLLHRSGRRLTQYFPRCADFSERRLNGLHVQYDESQRYCTVSEARQIETLFRSWRSPFRTPSGAFREVESEE